MPFQRVPVSANGHLIGERSVSSVGDFEAAIPADIVNAGNVRTIEFKLPPQLRHKRAARAAILVGCSSRYSGARFRADRSNGSRPLS